MPNYTNFTTDYPQSVAPISYDLSSIAQTQVSITQALNRTASDKGGQRWGISFNYAPLSRDEFAPIWTFLIKQRGRYGRFTIALPNQEPRGSLNTQSSLQLRAKNNLSAGNQLTIKNFVANQTGVIKQGDYFRIGSSSKVYIACEDYDSDSVGDVTVTTYPNIVNSVAVDDIIYFEPVFTVSLASDNLDANVPTTNNANFSVEFVEVVTNSGTQVIY
tara:strand:- start:500 stop:1150 length:651 start_codon:yes stop_codon:yes gene_type:complete